MRKAGILGGGKSSIDVLYPWGEHECRKWVDRPPKFYLILKNKKNPDVHPVCQTGMRKPICS
jgi:hypothetical protein